MKIGIDISQIVHEGTGVANYTRQLVENLLWVDQKNDYLLFGSSLRRRNKLNEFLPKTGKKTFSLPPFLLEKLWNQWHFWPIEKMIGQVDVFHSSDWLQPPSSAKKVTTVHDLTFLRYPKTFSARGGHDIVANQKKRLHWVKKEVDLIIADSLTTKKDLMAFLKIPAARIRVVYPAAHPRFGPQPKKLITKIRRKYELKNDYLLSVAAQEPRKNLRGVIKAHNFLISQYPHLQLVMAGKFAWGKGRFQNKRPGVKMLGFVPDDDLPALYGGASCFVYPSFWEGFGLPVLEAMSCGCPVVTSNVSSLPEIVGQAGVLVDPKKPKAIALGIKKAIGRRRQLGQKGQRRAQRFSWPKTAREVIKIYGEVGK